MQLTNFILTILLAISGLAIIGLVLMQHGKGADAGAGFGGGSANGVFGASGSANFLSRTTAIFAFIFFAVVIALNLGANYQPKKASLLNQLNQKTVAPNSNASAVSGSTNTTPASTTEVPK
jgi:preprotein translocase subunit SecG